MNWRRFFRRPEADAEQGDELEFYVEVTAQEYVERGMAPSDATAEARRKLGNATLIREEVYRMNTVTAIEGILRDARHALRMMRWNPGFSVAAILSLAIGVGANTAIFSVVNAVLLRPLSYPGAESLAGVFNSGVIQGEVFRDMGLAPGMYWALKDHSSAFQEFGVWSSERATVTGIGDPEQIKTVRMTEGVLAALGAQPFLGRRFSAGDDTPGTLDTVILSHGYWQRRFGGDERVLGRQVVIDFVPRQVIGVMPRSFRFLDLSPDVLLPRRFSRANVAFEPFSHSGIARLKPGVTIELANQESARILNQAMPENLRWFARIAQMKPNLRPLKQDVTGDVGTALGVLMGALSLVFLLVCANVANLVLVRAQGRTQEFAIRAALGAGWGRIARELLVESLTLGLVGGVCGLALACGAVEVLKAQDLTSIPRLAEVSIDARTLAFALASSVAGSGLFGLIAILRCGIPGRISHARGASLGLKQLRAQNLLVVAQVAMALVLLVGSGLLIRTFVALRGVRPGFTRPEQIQTLRVSIPATQVSEPDRVARMQAEIIENISRIPGVEAAGFADGLPMEEYRNGQLVSVKDRLIPGQPPPNRVVKYVSPGLFRSLGARMLAGRDFTWEDLLQRRLVAIVSEGMARENWGSPQAALGGKLRPGADGNVWFDVVGVVEDMSDDGPHKPAPTTVYFRSGVHNPWNPGRPPSVRRSLTLAIRSSRTGSESFLQEVSKALQAVNPNLPMAQVRTLNDVYRRSMARTSFTLVLLGIAGAMALGLAIVGVYGVLAYAVGNRRREVSIRVALGAQPAQVSGMFVRRGVLLAGMGCVVGMAAAMALSRWVSALLFGVTARDPATFAAAALLVGAAALVASYVPARRASAVDPMESLRGD